VQARLRIGPDGWWEATLDPRSDDYWGVDFIPEDGGYTTAFKLGSVAEDDWDEKEGPFETFGQAVRAAAATLRDQEEPFGPWAADTLEALFAP